METNWLAWLLIVGLITNCNLTAQQTVGTITPQELSDKLAQSEDIVIFDVRTQAEVSGGVIDSQILHIDFQKPYFEDRLLELDKNKTYAVYCRSGGRSSQAVSKMQEMGFTRIYNVEGGIAAWEEAGFSLANQK